MPRRADLLNSKKGLWLCNPVLNAVYSVRARAQVFETPWREYLGGPSALQVIPHAGYLLVATSPIGRALIASHHVRIEPELEGAESLLILGGNTRLRLFDHRRGEVTTILKDGFDDVFLRSELRFRTGSEDVLLITISMTGKDEIACGGYCISHLFMLEPYVALAKKNIGLEEDDGDSD